MRAAEHACPQRRGMLAQLRSRPWWPNAKRGLMFAFFALITWLLIEQARDIEWAEVGKAMGRLPHVVILSAAGLAALSYMVYTTFDLIGRNYTQHDLSTRRVMLAAFISYAFNLNLGSLVGGIAFRYRLYTKFGLSNDVITRLVGMSMFTNWLGYFALGGTVLCFFTPDLPEKWHISAAMLPLLGAVMLAVTCGYLLACIFSKQHCWKFRSHSIVLPTAGMALLQLALSMLNWMIMAGVIFTVLQAHIDYPTVLVVLLMAAVAGVITHIPGNMGVLEAAFIAMLSSRLPATELLAGLLAYRAVYYLLPLGLAALLFTCIEWKTSSTGKTKNH